LKRASGCFQNVGKIVLTPEGSTLKTDMCKYVFGKLVFIKKNQSRSYLNHLVYWNSQLGYMFRPCGGHGQASTNVLKLSVHKRYFAKREHVWFTYA
jgi:hypothetical protein